MIIINYFIIQAYLDNERKFHLCLLFGLQLLKQLQELLVLLAAP